MGDAFARALAEARATVRQNERGLRRSRDPEYLHQLRVTIRGARALTKPLRDIYGRSRVARLVDEWGWLARLTGPTRDLDVLAESLPRYARELSVEARTDLQPFVRVVEARREAALDELLEHLDSVRYRELLADWKDFTNKGALKGPATRGSAKRRIREWTWRRYRRTRASLVRLRSASSPEELHRARIELKKLRYLVEFFRSLFGRGPTRRVLKPLKKAQDTLGHLNDLTVHRALLRSMARTVHDTSPLPPETLLAMGELSALLDREKTEAMRTLRARVRPVIRRKARRAYAELYRR